MTTYLEDGNWWEIAPYDGGEPCVVLCVTALDLWLSPEEARDLAEALLREAVSVERAARSREDAA